jgi:TRAP-type C4-dicarboxylate transport system substrate-binding protein
MLMKRLTILAAGASLAAMFWTGGAAADEIRIAVGCPAVPACSDWVWADDFANHLTEAGMEAQVYVGGTLGRDAEVVDQLAQGLLQVGLTNFVMIAQVDSDVLGFIAPYMFDDMEHLFRALDETDIVESIDNSMQAQGIKIASLIGLGGTVGIFNTRHAVESLSDLEGLRLRAIDASQTAVIEEWGASSVVIDMTEFATSVQQGIADGYVNPPVVALIFQHTEFLKHYTAAGAGTPFRSVLMSNDWYNGLSDDHRENVDAAVAFANERNRDWTLRAAEQEINQLKERGVTVTELSPEARAEFVERSQASWPRLLDEQALQMFIDAAEQTRQ